MLSRFVSCFRFAAPFTFIAVGTLAAGGCGNDESMTVQEKALFGVKQEISVQLDALAASAVALRAAAPTPDADGWSATADAAAVNNMKAEWKKARIAYEKVEGAIAVIFPDFDASTDERYDGFIEAEADTNLFDGQGVTGVHGIERILWADSHPPQVIAFEAALPRYQAAKFPTTMQEARDFKEGLATRLVDDTKAMKEMFAPLALDTAAAFRGVIGSLAEQLEKVELGSTGEDESRYAQHTLGDMRANLAGGESTYRAFQPWLKSKAGGEALDAQILAGLARVKAEYAKRAGDALPAVPMGFNPEMPSAEHLATPYGEVLSLLKKEADPTDANSLVSQMSKGADLLEIPQIPE